MLSSAMGGCSRINLFLHSYWITQSSKSLKRFAGHCCCISTAQNLPSPSKQSSASRSHFSVLQPTPKKRGKEDCLEELKGNKTLRKRQH